jgi:hypothetical protein
MKVEGSTNMATEEPTENEVTLPTNHWTEVEGGVRIYRSSRPCPSCGSGNAYGDQLTPVITMDDIFCDQEIEDWAVSVRCDSCGAAWKQVLIVTPHIEP